MSEIAKYEKMLKDNQAAIKKLQERGKLIAAVIKMLKSLEKDEEKDADLPTTNSTFSSGGTFEPEVLE
jgi:hypothetical protein